MKSLRTALVQFGPFAAIALVAAWALSQMHVSYPHPSQAESLRFSSLAPVLGLGLLGAWLITLSGIPRACGKQESPAKKIYVPVVVGAALGLVAVALDMMFGITSTIASALGVPRIHLDAPYSLLAYTAGAIVVESIFRLLPLGIVTFFIGRLAMRGRHMGVVFWIAAVLTAVLEPLSQAALLSSRPVPMVVVGVFIFTFGLFSSWQLWRFGVVAPLLMRLAFYSVWHVTLGPLLAISA